MKDERHAGCESASDNSRRTGLILALATLSTACLAVLGVAGDLRENLPLLFTLYAILALSAFAAWKGVGRNRRLLRWALAAALVFRIVASLAPATLSDDVYRYVWDGRVQLHGIHPYRFAPSDPELAHLRDENWDRINHPELETIYPPVSQLVFAILAGLGAGPLGFKLAMALADFGVVLALAWLLRLLGLPVDRSILYAWNPLPILESGGSGHVEPLGILFVLLATCWIIRGRNSLSTLALAASIHVKLLPAILLPGHLRRCGVVAIPVLALALLAPILPYALTGPAVGAGLFAYAESWERNASVYAVVHWTLEAARVEVPLKATLARLQGVMGDDALPWDVLYRYVWPREVARGIVVLAALAWALFLAFRRSLDASRETFLTLAGVILLSPTVHPWYLLWVLPFAAAYLSSGWLLFGVTIVLAYTSPGGDVSWPVRCLEYLPPLAFVVWRARSRRSDPV